MRICVATMGPYDEADLAWRSVADLVDATAHVDPGTIERFDTARNDLLRYASEEGHSWALVLDTDETILIDPGFTQQDLRKQLETTTHDVLMVPHVDGTYSKERVFRLPARGRYHGATHEAFLLEEGASRGVLTGLRFNERPKSREQYRAKVERDLELLESETEYNPEDARWWYYLGDTREGAGDLDGALWAFRECFDLEGWDEEGAWAAYRAAVILAMLTDYEDALTWCCMGLTRRADFPELTWLAGWCCYQLGRYEQAISWAQLAITQGQRHPKPARVIFTHPPAHHEAPWDLIRWSERQLGLDPSRAEDGFNREKRTRENMRAG